MYDVRALNELVAKESAFVDRLTNEIGKVIVGQQYMVERILVGLLTGGDVILEGGRGLAKTLTVRTLCDAIHSKFARIQFTPDLLPADLVGTVVYNQQKGEFTSKLRAIFAYIVLGGPNQRAPDQGPELAPRGHAGETGHDRRQDLRAPRPLHRHGDAESDRTG